MVIGAFSEVVELYLFFFIDEEVDFNLLIFEVILSTDNEHHAWYDECEA